MTLNEKLKFCEDEMNLMIRDNDTYEHLRDHTTLAVAFFLIGLLFMFLYCVKKMKRIRFDYTLPKGSILRSFKGGKKYFIVNPTSTLHYFELLTLNIYDYSNEEVVTEFEKKRSLTIMIVLIIFIIIISIFGITELLSAFAVDMNPVNYLKYIPQLFH
jgi:cytosine/uracil/thiamine/allantoin permease